MTWQFDIVILTIIVICAFAAVSIKDLLGSAVAFGAYSFFDVLTVE